MAAHGYSAYSHGCRCDICRQAAATYRRGWRRRRRVRREAAGIANAARSAIRAGRIEDYQELRSWGLTRREAAERLGVTLRTVDRYDADLKAQRQVAA
jgi:hypothetical protein